MNARSRSVPATALGLMLAAVPIFAHHSFAAEYDAVKPIALTGTVTKVEWMNPHARCYLDVKDGSGTVTTWELSMGSVQGLFRAGWNRHMLKPEDTITANGYLAKDGSHLANLRSIILGDGRKMFTGAAPDAPHDGSPTK